MRKKELESLELVKRIYQELKEQSDEDARYWEEYSDIEYRNSDVCKSKIAFRKGQSSAMAQAIEILEDALKNVRNNKTQVL